MPAVYAGSIDCAYPKDSRSHAVGLPSELWRFMRARKKFWLAPIIVVMFLLGGLLILAKGSAVAPFIYTLF